MDLSLSVPRLSFLGKFEYEKFNGEFQAMLVEYNLDLKLTTKLLNSTNMDFQYFRFTDVKLTQNLKDFKMNFSNAEPISYGEHQLDYLIVNASFYLTVNLLKMSLEDRVEISKENRELITAFAQSLFIDTFNPVLSNIPYQILLSP